MLITLVGFSAYGQHSGPRLGIKIGTALSEVHVRSADPAYSPEGQMKLGILFGGFANILNGNKVIFQPALLYVKKGWRDDYGYGGYNQPLNYIEVPLNILIKVKPAPRYFYLGTGLSPAFNVTGYGTAGVKTFDLGINALAGYVWPLGFSINFGYTYGLLNANKSASTSKIKNRYLAITAAYEF